MTRGFLISGLLLRGGGRDHHRAPKKQKKEKQLKTYKSRTELRTELRTGVEETFKSMVAQKKENTINFRSISGLFDDFWMTFDDFWFYGVIIDSFHEKSMAN